MALAAATFALAGFAAYQTKLSRDALQQQDRDFRFEIIRQTFASAPMLVVEVEAVQYHRLGGGDAAPVISHPGQLLLANRGLGPAIKIRFSCLANGNTITAAQQAVPPLGQGGTYRTGIQVVPINESAFHADEFVARYEDVLGNAYASEYKVIWKSGGVLSWKRPWVGKEFGLPRPAECSEDDPPWGSSGREYVLVDGKMVR